MVKDTDWGNFKQWHKLDKLLRVGKLNFDDLAAIVPGILHINSRHDLSFRYMSKKGCDLIGYTNNQLQTGGSKIIEKHQSSFTREITHPKIFKELNNACPDKVILFYQDWKKLNKQPFFFLTTSRVWNKDEFLSISFFPGEIQYLTQKVNRLFGINSIFLKYFKVYNKLTRREKEILDLLGQEQTRNEIATQLFVSESTIKKHCENIYRKLGTHKRTELEKIAVAFVSLEN